ncbi:glycosyltransferase [Dermatophilus congolensis]|uniref:glycosyltransferase n=1 Tax=Dermatophilus congolensis TaxID=1863 RepID=UPI001AAE4588|nr:glycosyltransferase [Dermatophilus congolensis]MBO3154857.1 glycosyltransferase [Dermatophilus congolensis]MBO3188720.1 glycosyltransferase [Dermatophilus congolensis]MBO3197713.1 glycosyltransferase [Dermatophilus congolensis]MBO3214529.1 glycosyltransferase [Dermatophilus congolensis]
MHPVLSVVIPVYNEEEVLPLMVERLRPVLDGLGQTYEVVAVDDGSKDKSALVMARLRRSWPQFRIIRLRANSGHQAAISAGLARAHGDYVVTIDADLQDPPETIAEMLELAQQKKLDVVYGIRSDRSTDTAFKRGTAQAFYATLRHLSKTDAPANAGDFRLMSRATVDAVNALPEHHRVLRLVVPQLGFPSGEVYYKREERAAGESKYPLSKMIALSVDSLTAGSMAPLRLATWFGVLGFVGAVLIFFYALISSLTDRAVAGWTSTVMAVSAVGGAQLICVGILGEYVGRMYSMMQGRPTYFVTHDTDFISHENIGENEPTHHDTSGDRDFLTELADLDVPASGEIPMTRNADTPAVTAEATAPETPASLTTPDAATATENKSSTEKPAAASVTAFTRAYEETATEPALVTASGEAAEGTHPDTPRTQMIDAEARQAVRRTSANKLTPGSEETGK